MGCCPSQNTQNQCQGDAVVPGEGGQGHHAAHNAPPVKMGFFHCLCLGVILASIVSHKSIKNEKNDLNVLTNIKAGAITPNQINSPTNCTSSSPTSMILEKKEVMSLENQTRSTP